VDRVNTEPKVRYELMTPGEIVEVRARCPIAFVPVSPIEWHGPHLPVGADGLVAHHVALQVALRTGGVVLPPLFAGTDTVRPLGEGPQAIGSLGFTGHQRIFGMNFPGFPVKSLYFEESALGIAVREIVRGLKADGWRLIVITNGHGAGNHVQTLRRIAAEETERGRVHVALHPRYDRPRPADIDPGHAERWETSILMAVSGPNVRIDALPPLGTPLRYPDYGIIDGSAFDGRPAPDFALPDNADPRHSSREEGEKLLALTIGFTAEQVTRQLNEVLEVEGSC
jgi:creatinine amidohydrolase